MTKWCTGYILSMGWNVTNGFPVLWMYSNGLVSRKDPSILWVADPRYLWSLISPNKFKVVLSLQIKRLKMHSFFCQQAHCHSFFLNAFSFVGSIHLITSIHIIEIMGNKMLAMCGIVHSIWQAFIDWLGRCYKGVRGEYHTVPTLSNF